MAMNELMKKLDVWKSLVNILGIFQDFWLHRLEQYFAKHTNEITYQTYSRCLQKYMQL